MSVKSRINPVTTTRARSPRSAMTDAERLLWGELRSSQLDGHRFRRQHPVGKYIADFACIEQKIVIELDVAGNIKINLIMTGGELNF